MAIYEINLKNTIACTACTNLIYKTAKKYNSEVKDIKNSLNIIVVDSPSESLYLQLKNELQQKFNSNLEFHDFVKNTITKNKGYETEFMFLIFGLITTIVLLGLGFAIMLLTKSLPTNFYSYLIITLLAFGVSSSNFISEYCRKYEDHVDCNTAMMKGMTMSMTTGIITGSVIGATNGMFIGSLFGSILGTVYGIKNSCKYAMAYIESLLGGFMGGTMGAMTSVMLISDNITIFLPLTVIIMIVVQALLAYLLKKDFEALLSFKEAMFQTKKTNLIKIMIYSILLFMTIIYIISYLPKSVSLFNLVN
ncbi:MAG: chloride channel protein [Candidatus Micrarchaeota archaeon]|nr:chloride channel protein [Candidatus Micrarchaeota archaeon]